MNSEIIFVDGTSFRIPDVKGQGKRCKRLQRRCESHDSVFWMRETTLSRRLADYRRVCLPSRPSLNRACRGHGDGAITSGNQNELSLPTHTTGQIRTDYLSFLPRNGFICGRFIAMPSRSQKIRKTFAFTLVYPPCKVFLIQSIGRLYITSPPTVMKLGSMPFALPKRRQRFYGHQVYL
jgi:hypothetical protein